MLLITLRSTKQAYEATRVTGNHTTLYYTVDVRCNPPSNSHCIANHLIVSTLFAPPCSPRRSLFIHIATLKKHKRNEFIAYRERAMHAINRWREHLCQPPLLPSRLSRFMSSDWKSHQQRRLRALNAHSRAPAVDSHVKRAAAAPSLRTTCRPCKA